MTPAPAFELTIEVKLLTQFLKTIEDRDSREFTYAEASEITGSEVVGGTSTMQSALHRALKNHGLVFANIRGVGYRLLNDEEIVKSSFHDARAIGRKARRSGERLTKVRDYNSLGAQEKLEHNARLSVFSAMATMTKTKTLEKIELAVGVVNRELPFAETLAAFNRSTTEDKTA